MNVDLTVDISLNLRAAVLERRLDMAFLMGPVSEFTVENVALPPFDLHWYRSAQNEETDLSVIPVISYASQTRPYRELRAELSRRIGPQVRVFTSASLSASLKMIAAGIAVGPYAMALATSWGMSYTLLELGHVWIDLLRSRCDSFGRALFDLFSMLVSSAVVITTAVKAWPVVNRSLSNGSRANTPLETPLAWVQVPWFAGWVWFALMVSLTTLAALSLVVKRRYAQSETIIGAFAEQETLQ